MNAYKVKTVNVLLICIPLLIKGGLTVDVRRYIQTGHNITMECPFRTGTTWQGPPGLSKIVARGKVNNGFQYITASKTGTKITVQNFTKVKEGTYRCSGEQNRTAVMKDFFIHAIDVNISIGMETLSTLEAEEDVHLACTANGRPVPEEMNIMLDKEVIYSRKGRFLVNYTLINRKSNNGKNIWCRVKYKSDEISSRKIKLSFKYDKRSSNEEEEATIPIIIICAVLGSVFLSAAMFSLCIIAMKAVRTQRDLYEVDENPEQGPSSSAIYSSIYDTVGGANSNEPPMQLLPLDVAVQDEINDDIDDIDDSDFVNNGNGRQSVQMV